MLFFPFRAIILTIVITLVYIPSTDEEPANGFKQTTHLSLFGQRCSTDNNCSDKDNLKCFKRIKTCICKPGCMYDYVKEKCVEMNPVLFGQKCSSDDNCSRTDIHLKCFKGLKVCLCKNGYKYNQLERKCVHKNLSLFGQKCSTDNNCSDKDHLKCDEGIQICLCKPGYLSDYVRGKCIETNPVLLGKKCSSDDNCSRTDIHLKCNKEFDACLCTPGYQYNHLERKCQSKNLTHDLGLCISSSECQRKDPRMVCSSFRCQCKENYTLIDISADSVCSKQALVNMKCEFDYDCSGLFTYCIYGMCQCRDYFTFSNNSCKYDQSKKLFEMCASTEQCVMGTVNSICHSNRCQCLPGQHSHDVEGKLACGRKANVGDLCTKYDLFENSECLNGRCICRDGYVAENAMCVEKQNFKISDIIYCITIFFGVLCIVLFLWIIRYRIRKEREIKESAESSPASIT